MKKNGRRKQPKNGKFKIKYLDSLENYTEHYFQKNKKNADLSILNDPNIYKHMYDLWQLEIIAFRERQSGKGTSAGNKISELGIAQENIKKAHEAHRYNLENDPEYRERFRQQASENGTKVITDLNTRPTECPVCGEIGPYNSWKRYHFEWCGKPREYSEAELKTHKAFGEAGAASARIQGPIIKKQYDDAFQEFYDKCPDVITKHQAYEMIAEMGYKPNYNWLKRPNTFDKVAHNIYRKVGSDAPFKTENDVLSEEICKYIPDNEWYGRTQIFNMCAEHMPSLSSKNLLYALTHSNYFDVQKTKPGQPSFFRKKIETNTDKLV
jgi:hypothetical protein